MIQLAVIFYSIFLLSCTRHVITNPQKALRVTNAPDMVKDDLDLNEFRQGIEKHIHHLMKRPEQQLTFGQYEVKAKDYAKELSKLILNSEDEDFVQYIQKNFLFMEVYGREKWGEILLTSYYEPIYPARKKPTDLYFQPIYKAPDDLVELDLMKLSGEDLGNFESTRRVLGGRIVNGPGIIPRVVPYFNREEIDIEQKLKDKNLELYYLDPIHAFFLQIQGSGGLILEDGTEVRIGYAAQNGWKYESIGKQLLHIIPKEEMSLQKIEAYLRTLGREELYDFLKINPSYVFFKILKGRGLTTFGNEVISGRTLAIDSSLLPLGSIAYLNFQKPFYADESVEVPSSYQWSSRFVLAQDTGGAIKTAGRADLYWGQGKEALRYAGTMRHEAKLWILLPKTLAKKNPVQNENIEK